MQSGRPRSLHGPRSEICLRAILRGSNPVNARRLDDLILELRDSLVSTIVMSATSWPHLRDREHSIFLDDEQKTYGARDSQEALAHPPRRRVPSFVPAQHKEFTETTLLLRRFIGIRVTAFVLVIAAPPGAGRWAFSRTTVPRPDHLLRRSVNGLTAYCAPVKFRGSRIVCEDIPARPVDVHSPHSAPGGPRDRQDRPLSRGSVISASPMKQIRQLRRARLLAEREREPPDRCSYVSPRSTGPRQRGLCISASLSRESVACPASNKRSADKVNKSSQSSQCDVAAPWRGGKPPPRRPHVTQLSHGADCWPPSTR